MINKIGAYLAPFFFAVFFLAFLVVFFLGPTCSKPLKASSALRGARETGFSSPLGLTSFLAFFFVISGLQSAPLARNEILQSL